MINEGITGISDSAFLNSNSHCRTIQTVILSDSVTLIENYAFSGLENIENVSLSKNIERIGDGAFQSSEKLTRITVPDSRKSMGGWICPYAIFTILAMVPPVLTAYGSFSQTIYVPAESVDAYKAASGWSMFANIIQAIE